MSTGRFWELHDLLLENQNELHRSDILGYAGQLDIDMPRFLADVRSRRFASRMASDIRSADESGVAGTPTFFIDGRRHNENYDLNWLRQTIAEVRRLGSEGVRP